MNTLRAMRALRKLARDDRGTTAIEYAVIATGVSAGDKVITAGQLGLANGEKITPSVWQPPVSVTERMPSPTPKPAQ